MKILLDGVKLGIDMRYLKKLKVLKDI